MRVRPRLLPLARSCSIAAATCMAAILTGSVLTSVPAAATVAASAGGTPATSLAGGVLSGTVRGPGGARLARVCVVATGRTATRAAVSASDGRYVITGLPPGSYAIGFRDCGAAGQHLSQWYGGSVLPDGAARVQVSAATPVTLKPVTLKPVGGMRAVDRAAARRAASGVAPAASGPSISGVVRNASGKGLTGVCVQAFTSTATSVSGVGTQTGAGGHYSLPVRRGKWEVDFANGCGGKYAPQWWKHVGSQAKA